MSSKIFIVLINWNGYQVTLDCIKSLKGVDYDNYEIIVVDNASSDGSQEVIKETFSDVILIENEENVGVARANNNGVIYAMEHGADYVLLLNNDTVVDPQILNEFLKVVSARPDAGVFAAKMYYCDKPDVLWYAGGIYDKGKKHFYHIGYRKKDEGEKYNQIREIDQACGCGLFIKREVIEKIGLIDPRYFLMFDDTDWSTQAIKNGYKCLFVPEAKLWHKVGFSRKGKTTLLYPYFYKRNGLLWARRNLPVFERWGFYIKSLKDLFLDSSVNRQKEEKSGGISYKIRRRKKNRYIFKAELLGFRDFILNRFGNWPEDVQELNKRYKKSLLNTRIKVLFVPNWREGNPYQNLLMASLTAQGVDVIIDNYKKGFLGLFKTIRAHRDCDVIHLHWIQPYCAWLFVSRNGIKRAIKYLIYIFDIFLVKLSGKKIIWTIHNKYMHESQNYLWERRLRRILFKMADHVLVHSRSAIKEIESCYGINRKKGFSVVPHGNYIGCYPNEIDKGEARKELDIDSDKRVFLYFGLIRSYKGVQKLITVFNQKESLKVKDAILLLVGKPNTSEIKQEIKDLAEDNDNIKLFLDFVPNEQIQVYMNAADIVVFPFEKILTSGSVMLAMSFAKAVFVPRSGCLVDLLDEKGAFYFDQNKPLGEVLEDCLGADYERMGMHNKELAEKYDWDTIGINLVTIYKNALGEQ